jgi:hypothetical protein
VTSFYAFILLVPVTIPGSVGDLLANEVTIGGTNYQIIPTNTTNSNYQQITVRGITYNLIPVTSADTTYPQIYDKHVLFKLAPIAITNVKFGPIQPRDQTFYNGFFAGIYYVTATTFTFAYAIVGAQVFRKTVLGIPWGLLLGGLGLVSIADISYYYFSIYSYDRTNPIIGMYLAGCMIVCYALYRHKKQL